MIIQKKLKDKNPFYYKTCKVYLISGKKTSLKIKHTCKNDSNKHLKDLKSLNDNERRSITQINQFSSYRF